MIVLIDDNLQTAGKTMSLLRSNWQGSLWTAALAVTGGMVFLAWGLLSEPRLILSAVLGGLMLTYGLFSTVRVLRTPRFNAAQSSAPEESNAER